MQQWRCSTHRSVGFGRRKAAIYRQCVPGAPRTCRARSNCGKTLTDERRQAKRVFGQDATALRRARDPHRQRRRHRDRVPAVVGARAGADDALAARGRADRALSRRSAFEFTLPLAHAGTRSGSASGPRWRRSLSANRAPTARSRARCTPRRAQSAAPAARNPIALVVPCHRVVGSRGALGGFMNAADGRPAGDQAVATHARRLPLRRMTRRSAASTSRDGPHADDPPPA